jgi:hypothetical protein
VAADDTATWVGNKQSYDGWLTLSHRRRPRSLEAELPNTTGEDHVGNDTDNECAFHDGEAVRTDEPDHHDADQGDESGAGSEGH